MYSRGRVLQRRHPRKGLSLDGRFEQLPAGESFEEDPSGWASLLGLP